MTCIVSTYDSPIYGSNKTCAVGSTLNCSCASDSNSSAFGNEEYLFIGISPESILTRSGSTF